MAVALQPGFGTRTAAVWLGIKDDALIVCTARHQGCGVAGPGYIPYIL